MLVHCRKTEISSAYGFARAMMQGKSCIRVEILHLDARIILNAEADVLGQSAGVPRDWV